MLEQLIHYSAPTWLLHARGGIATHSIPSFKLSLGRLPTPIQSFKIPGLEELGLSTFIKRDDLSSFDLSGNKVRKLEFLLADAIHNNHDSVITIGGIQSNHCRATAVAARQLGFQPHLILRKAGGKSGQDDEEVGITGNLLFDRMVGSQLYTVSASTYAQVGSENLCRMLEEQLKVEGKHPYVIPVGGSNAIGVFGYVECIREIMEQSSESYDHIVFACGSGGTVAGLAIGAKLAGLNSKLHAIGVCDSPEYFYNHIEEVSRELGLNLTELGPVSTWCNIYNGQGIGYARSTEEELKYLIEVGEQTGILFDPVYSGKALYYFVKNVVKNHPEVFQKGQRVLFIHTGGVIGLYEKESQLIPLLAPKKQVQKLKIVP